MPKRNLAGGKAFKKGRKLPTEGSVDDKRFDGLDEGQDLGRVTKMLGNRRVLCFCGNDGMERVCKIRGVLCKGPKKQRIEIGDIVLISSRDYSATTYVYSDDEEEEGGGAASTHVAKMADGGAVTSNGKRDVYDLITKLSASQIRDARRTEKGLHKSLFEVAGHVRTEDNSAFVIGYDSEEEDDNDSEEEETGHTGKRNKIRHRGGARGGAGAEDDGCDAMPLPPADDSDRDVDIDAI